MKNQDSLEVNELSEITPSFNFKLEFSVTKQDTEDINKVIEELKIVSNEYYSTLDIADVNKYDILKKKIAAHLETLAYFKDKYNEELYYLEEKLKKEGRMEIALQIKKYNNISLSQAEKLVEVNDTYKKLRDTLHKFRLLAVSVKTNYDFYLKVMNLIFQSVSTANKEKNNSNNCY